jgi:hypothetical protein
LNKRYGTAFPKQQKRTLYIKEIPEVDPNAPDYEAARVAAIENNHIQINDYLLTQTSTMVNTLQIYEEHDFLILNCLIINEFTHLNYMQDTKESIIINLIEIINKIINLLQVNFVVRFLSRTKPSEYLLLSTRKSAPS